MMADDDVLPVGMFKSDNVCLLFWKFVLPPLLAQSLQVANLSNGLLIK